MVGGMVFADQSDLYWFGYGVGIFHSAADSASGRAAVAAVWVRDDGGMAVSARGEISIFCGRRCYAVFVVSVLCAAGSCAAFSLYAALQIGRREDEPFLRRWYWLFVPAALLIGGILTNDWH